MVRRRVPNGVALVVLAALGGAAALLVALLVAVDRDSGPPAAPATEPSRAAALAPSTSPQERGAGRDAADQVRGPLLGASPPVTLRIPRIGVETRLVRLGLDESGAMEVPADPAEAGWFTGAPTPGALGPSVIAGHVTWDRVPAVFFRLGELRRGDRVEVLRHDRRTAVFAVSRVLRFAKDRFPTEAVYGRADHAALRLITCGGAYDARAARYADNVVVFARLVQVRPTEEAALAVTGP